MLEKRVVIIGRGVWGLALESLLSINVSSVFFWDRKSVINTADILILALPVSSMRMALQQASPSCQLIVNTSKGIEQDTNYLPYQIVQELLGKRVDYYALMGASFANELALKMPTLVNLGYQGGKSRMLVRDMFQTEYFRVRFLPEFKQLEFASAFKNVYAIVCGLADGMGFGVNTRVALISLALHEMRSFFWYGE